MDEIEASPMADLLGVVEIFQPVMDVAKGLRASLEAEGFSPTASEDVAREFMVSFIRKAMS